MMPKDLIYMDTDSFFTREKMKTQDKIGGLELQETVKKLLCVKPKFYIKDTIPKIKVCHNVNYKDFYSIISDGNYQQVRLVKFREGTKGKHEYNEEVMQVRDIDLEDNKRIWKGKFNQYVKEDSIPIKLKIKDY